MANAIRSGESIEPLETLRLTRDGRLIDGLGPDGVSARVVDLAGRVARLQTGYVYHYAFVMLIGLTAAVTWVIAR